MGINGLFHRAGKSLPSIVKGGLTDAATLHLLRSGDRIKTSPSMATAVAKGMVGPIIPMDHYDTSRKTFLLFKAYGPVRASEFRSAGKIQDDSPVFKGPATIVGWLFGGTYSEQTLDNIPMKPWGLHGSRFLLGGFGILIPGLSGYLNREELFSSDSNQTAQSVVSPASFERP